MGDIRVVQQVRSGVVTEYYGVAGQAVAIVANDKLIMSFDTELHTEEIIVVNGGSLTWSMKIVYPQTGLTNFVYSSTGNYTLNGGDAGAGL